MGLTAVFVLLMCGICTCTVKLNLWFLMDIEYEASASFDVLVVTPEAIWRNLKSSGLLRGHLADSYTVASGICNLDGTRQMMRKFTPKDVHNVHGFVGPICTYMCDVTGLISSTYSIPQVCDSCSLTLILSL